LLDDTGKRGTEKFDHLRRNNVRIPFTGDRHKDAADQFLLRLPDRGAVRRVYKEKTPFQTEPDDEILLMLDKILVKILRLCRDYPPVAGC
jgi:hypothetical protein